MPTNGGIKDAAEKDADGLAMGLEEWANVPGGEIKMSALNECQMQARKGNINITVT